MKRTTASTTFEFSCHVQERLLACFKFEQVRNLLVLELDKVKDKEQQLIMWLHELLHGPKYSVTSKPGTNKQETTSRLKVYSEYRLIYRT
jgi:hypothetical protein